MSKILTGDELFEQLAKMTPEQRKRPVILSITDDEGEIVNRMATELDTCKYELGLDLFTYSDDREKEGFDDALLIF